MTKNFKVNFLSNSIEVTTSFAKKASIYGSTEYLMLTEAQKAHPTYTLEIQKPKKTAIKGIDYDFMRKYISTHDEHAELLTAFEKLVNGKYQEEMDTYINDHFIFRNAWIKIKSATEMLLR